MESITQFFYNIVPGSIFLATLYLVKIRDFTKDFNSIPKDLKEPGIIIFSAIITSLFVGFIFQALTKILRFFLLKAVFLIVKMRDESTYEIALDYLRDFDTKEGTDRKKAFFLMHNYLEGIDKAKLPRIFTATSAFWSNMSIGSFILLLIEICWKHDVNLAGLFSLVLIVSLAYSVEYLRTQYDIVLKTFTTLQKIKEPQTKLPKSLNRSF